jgi:hypothetical protein
LNLHFTISDTKLNDGTIHALTGTLILHPIGAGLSGLAVMFGLYVIYLTIFHSHSHFTNLCIAAAEHHTIEQALY